MDTLEMSILPSTENIRAAPRPSEPTLFRPSEYTAALIQALRRRADWVRRKRVLELGSGSGVVLAAMSDLGAASLCGIDIESEAVAAGAVLLRRVGHRSAAELHQGDMWGPAADRRFDLIAANLPQFPMEPHACGGRMPSWSSGGANGRHRLDPFFAGLSDHLAPGGRAIITHNGFVDLDLSRAMAARAGLSLRLAATVLVPIPAEKLQLMTPGILIAEQGRSIHCYGPYAFAEVHVVEIGTAAALG